MVGAVPPRLETGPLSVEGLQRLIDRLPAEARTRLAWAPSELAGSVSSFLDGAMDETSVSSLASELGRVSTSIGPAVLSLMDHVELLRSELETVWRSESGLLCASLDPDTADLAEWTVRSWIAFGDLSLSFPARSRSTSRRGPRRGRPGSSGAWRR